MYRPSKPANRSPPLFDANLTVAPVPASTQPSDAVAPASGVTAPEAGSTRTTRVPSMTKAEPPSIATPPTFIVGETTAVSAPGAVTAVTDPASSTGPLAGSPNGPDAGSAMATVGDSSTASV